MYAGEYPVQLSKSWLPVDIAGGTQIEEPDSGPGGIYSRLAELGHEPADYQEEPFVRVPSEDEASELDLDLDHRVYDLTRLAIDAQGRVVEINKIIMPTHQWRLIYNWHAL